MKFFVVDAPLEDPCSPDAFARCLGLDTYGGGLARGGRPRRSKDPSRRRDRRGGLWNWKSLSLVVGTFLVSYLCWTSRSTRRKAREAGTDGGASAPSSPPTDDITGVGGGEARPFLRLGGLLQGGRSDSSKRRDDLARARGGWGPEPIHKGFDKAIVFDYPLPRVTERDSVSTSCGNHSGVESASTPNPCGDHGHGRLVGSAGEFVGEAERYERGVGDRNAPLWARPSRAELEALVKNQVGVFPALATLSGGFLLWGSYYPIGKREGISPGNHVAWPSQVDVPCSRELIERSFIVGIQFITVEA